ncbi:MAG: hypothetical protein EOO61_12790 [Hymenobacter sp.]|nr:MAG: hypothetical protein EOO61_12790 [Hymenobacter sp.]
MNLPPLLVQLVFLGVLSLLTGCQDPTTGITQVEGRIINNYNGQAVGGASVQVYHASTAGGYGQVGPSYPADAQGRFSFQFDATSKSGYLVRASTPLGYSTDWAVAPSLTAGRKNTGLVITMLAPAWVRLQVVDKAPKNRVSMHISGYDGPGDQLNYPRDTTLIRPMLAGYAGKIIWVIRDATNTPTQYSQDVKLAPLDTLTIPISF